MEIVNRVIKALIEVHPTHPMVVHFPIALTGAAFLFILLALWRRSEMLEQTAFANITLAAFSTVFAGITGIRANAVNYLGDAPNAEAKMILAIALFLITTITAVARWRNPELINQAYKKGMYIAAYGLSFALASILAFLGGVILYGF